MLDSEQYQNASQAKVDLRSAFEWARTAWEELSVKTVRNCWNHAKILRAPVVATGPDDTVVNELADLLLQFSDSGLRVEDVLNDVTEQWTAAPVESDDEDAECRAAMEAAEPDEEEADVSELVVPMTLRDARARSRYLCRRTRAWRLCTHILGQLRLYPGRWRP